MQQPSVGRIVHYVSYGTPGGEYGKECRAAVITQVMPLTDSDAGQPHVGLCVLNPTGQFFNPDIPYDAGTEQPGAPDCPDRAVHGNPFRYCGCGWSEATPRGGTWHWPEQV